MSTNRFSWSACAALLVATGACAPNPADDAPAALVSSGPTLVAPTNGEAALVPPVEEAASDAAGAEPTAADAGSAPTGGIPLSGAISFTASKVTRSHDCVFATWNGALDPGAGTPETATLSFSVDVASVGCDASEGGNERLEKHLRSDDFFAVESYPAATFVSTAITVGGEAGATHTVTGDLTIRGIARQISFPATVEVADQRVKAKAEFSVNRQDWEIRYPGQPDDLVRDNVLIKVDLAGEA